MSGKSHNFISKLFIQVIQSTQQDYYDPQYGTLTQLLHWYLH